MRLSRKSHIGVSRALVYGVVTAVGQRSEAEGRKPGSWEVGHPCRSDRKCGWTKSRVSNHQNGSLCPQRALVEGPGSVVELSSQFLAHEGGGSFVGPNGARGERERCWL